MKKQTFLRYLTSICFLVLIGVFFLLSLYPFAAGSYRMLRDMLNGTPTSPAVIESVYNERMPAKNLLVTVNGGLQKLLGTRSINDRVLLDNGQLTYTIDAYDMTGIAANTVALRDMLDERGIPMVYVNAPFKIDGADKQLPEGVEDFSNENADRFLGILKENNLNVLDLRELIHREGLEYGELFYRTDHHWKAETGFWAFTRITEYLAKLDEQFTVDAMVTDAANYDHTVYEDIFLGTAGRRVGPLYSGWDDLTVIAPKFATDLQFVVEEEGLDRRGDYGDTVLFSEFLSGGDDFTVSRYDVYCGQDYGKLQITNHSDGTAPAVTGKRILVIKDSFSSVVIPFLSLAYEELCFLDLRVFSEDLTAFVDEYRPDLVMVLYNPGAYENNNLAMFDFVS